LLRVQGGPGDSGTHLENRLGEPAANPYLYLAADIAAGLDGVERGLTPPAAIVGNPYESAAPTLPTSMTEALDALGGDPVYREQFGNAFVDYLLMMKRAEVTRAAEETADAQGEHDDSAAQDWEMREYFEFF
jgi:glutamine synthetase